MQKQLRTTTHAASMQKTQTNVNRWFMLAIVLLLSLIGAKAGFGQTTIHGRWNFDPNNNADVNRSLGSEVSLGPGPVTAGTVAVFFPGTGISTTAPSGQVTRATGTGAITASAAAG